MLTLNFNTLNEPVPRLIRMLVCDCFLCLISEASIYPAAFVILSEYKEVYLKTRMSAVPVWLVQESFLQDEFSVKVPPTPPKKTKEIP